MASRAPAKRRGLKITLGIIGGLVVLLLIGAALAWWYVTSKFNEIETIEEVFPDETLRPEENDSEALNILLLGSDSREDASDSLMTDLGSRADTIMVVHIPADRESMQIMSIMRDSWVDIPGHGEAKINAAMSYGGVPLMVQTVEGLLEQRIDHVAIVDFNGFQGITDALGGVTIYNPNEFSSGGFDFPAGKNELNGEQALVFVRERYSFEDGDYQRVHNQQLYLKAMLDQVISRDTLTDPGKLNDLLGAVTPYVATDSGLDLATMFSLGQSMLGLHSGMVSSFTLPTTGTGTEGDQSVVYLDTDELEVVREKFANDGLVGYQPAARP